PIHCFRNEYHLPIHPVLDRVCLTSKYVTFIRNKYSKQSILEGFKLATRTPAMSFTADSISSPQSTSYPSFMYLFIACETLLSIN
ncbi:hypothetical protein RclHR1_03130026, partial [Rhizophagus clarus]